MIIKKLLTAIISGLLAFTGICGGMPNTPKEIVCAAGESLSIVSKELDSGGRQCNKIEGRPGEKVTLYVYIACNNNFESLDVTVNWNDSSLSSSQAYSVSKASIASVAGDGYCTIVAYVPRKPLSDGAIVAIDFTIPEYAKPGKVYDLSFGKVDTFCIYQGLNIASTVSCKGASITVIDGSKGTCGDNLTWTLDEKGVLTISGSGEMTRFSIQGGPYSPFENRDDILSVNIDEGVTSIPPGTFIGCKNLKNIKVPSTVNDIYIMYGGFGMGGQPISPFYGCTSLEEINVSEGNEKYTSTDGVLFNKDKIELLVYPAGKRDEYYAVPESVERFGEKSWGDSEAFSENSFIRTIEIRNSIEAISPINFLFCENLESIDIVNNNTRYKSVDGVVFNTDMTELVYYPMGKKDKSYIVPNGVDVIDCGSFNRCSALESIVLPESVCKIQYQTFCDCKELKDITIKNPKCEIDNSEYTINNGYDANYNYYFNGTIHGYKNSTAQDYAAKYGYRFKALDDEHDMHVETTTAVTETKPVITTNTTTSTIAVTSPQAQTTTEGAWAIWKGKDSYTLKVGEKLELLNYVDVGGYGGYYCEASSDDESIASVDRNHGYDSGDPFKLDWVVYANKVGTTTITYSIATPVAHGFSKRIEIIVVDDSGETAETTALTTVSATTTTSVTFKTTAKTTTTVTKEDENWYTTPLPETTLGYTSTETTSSSVTPKTTISSNVVTSPKVTDITKIVTLKTNMASGTPITEMTTRSTSFSTVTSSNIITNSATTSFIEPSTEYTTTKSETSITTFLTSTVTSTTAKTSPTYEINPYLSKDKLDMTAGDKIHLKVNEYHGSIKWTSADESVAFVDDSGNVTAIGEGNTVIAAMFGKTVLTCEVTVEKCDTVTIQGDSNGDGIVNVRDAAHIAKMLAQGKTSELSSEADFNGDGKVNVRDAAAIAKFLATGKK